MLRQCFFVILVLLAFVACKRQSAGVPEVDSAAPPFAAQDLDGEAVALSDWRGRPVLLDFWATWCAPCKEEFPLFQLLMDQIPELVVVAVAVGDSDAQIRSYMEQTAFHFVTVADPRSEIAGPYGVTALPTTCLIGPDGVLLRHEVGKIDAEEWRAAILALLAPTARTTPPATGLPGEEQPTPAVTMTPKDALPSVTSASVAAPSPTGATPPVMTQTATATALRASTASRTLTPQPSPTSRWTSTATATVRRTNTPLSPTAPPPSATSIKTRTPTPTPPGTRTPTPTRVPIGLRLESCCTDKDVLPGETVVFEANLTNAGGGRDRFDVWLNKALPSNWQGMFCIGTTCYLGGTVVVELDAGASQAIEVKVRAADNAAIGSQGHVTLGAASQSDGNVRQTVSMGATVVAPTPTALPSPTPSQTAMPYPTMTATPVPSATYTELPLPSATATEAPTPSAVPTATGVPEPSPTVTGMPEPSPTATEMPGPEPTITEPPSPVPTPTEVPEPGPTATEASVVTPHPTTAEPTPGGVRAQKDGQENRTWHVLWPRASGRR